MTQPPLTAWQQAVIVTLFAVLLLGFLGGVYFFVRALIKQLTDFIERRDADWQEYFEKRETAFSERNAGIVKTIEGLIDKVAALDMFIQKAVTRMDERTRPLTPREPPKQGGET